MFLYQARRFGRSLFPGVAIPLLCGAALLAQDAGPKEPVPSEAAQKEASALLKEVYGEQYDEAKSSAQKLALAEVLLKKAAESKGDPVGRFVLLRFARDVAVEAGETETALQAIDRLGGAFEVDALEMKAAAIAKLAGSARFTAQRKTLAASVLGLVDEATGRDDYQMADQLVDAGLAAARKARDGSLMKSLDACKKRVKSAAQAYAEVQDALATLKQEPIDPEANLAAGKYYCLVKGDWEKGISMLALGSDAALRALAKQELLGPGSPSEQVELGDGWWDLAQQEEAGVKEALLLRAGHWYRQAQPRVTSALLKTKLTKRLEEIAKLEHPAAEVVGHRPEKRPPGVKTVERFDPATAELRGVIHTRGRNHVNGLAFSPDGRTLFSVSRDDHRVRIWDLARGQLRGTLGDLPGIVRGGAYHTKSVAMSADGSVLAWAGTQPWTVKLWSPSTGQQGQTAGRHNDDILGVAVSPDGSIVASGSVDKTVKLWDPVKGQLLRSIDAHLHVVDSVAFSPDGTTVASASRDATVKLWDAASGEARRTLQAPAALKCVAFSPDGSLVAAGSADRSVILWPVATGQLLRRLEGHEAGVVSIAFSPDSSTLASTGEGDYTVILWDVGTGQLRRTLEGFHRYARGLAFSPDGSILATGDNVTVRLWGFAPSKGRPGTEPPETAPPGKPDKTEKTTPTSSRPATTPTLRFGPAPAVSPFDPTTAQPIGMLSGHRDYIFSLAFSPDGAILFSGGRSEPTVKLWDMATGRLRGSISPPPQTLLPGVAYHVHALAISADGSTLAWGGAEPWTVKLWKPATGELRETLGGHAADISAVAVSPDGSVVASASGAKVDNALRLWDAATGKPLRTLEGHSDRVGCLAFSPDGSRLASGERHKRVILWEVATGKRLQTLFGPAGAGSVAFSPDGSTLVSSHRDYVMLWDPATGKLRRTLGESVGGLGYTAFHPDGSLLASSNPNLTVTLWDVASGELRRTLPGFSKPPRCLAFSPDGSVLAVADHNTVKLWGSASRKGRSGPGRSRPGRSGPGRSRP